MTLPASGPLSLTDIQTEFGGTNPIGMNEYYAGGGLVPAATSGTYGPVPSSGALTVQNFYGTTALVPIYIEEVFSAYLYTGTAASQTITNGIDLSTKGGLVWLKSRSFGNGHNLYDTNRGINKSLFSQATTAEYSAPNLLTAFNANGFTVGSAETSNESGSLSVSWTFRKQPKFFDIQTWTGTGSVRTIAHNLGSVPACIIVKCTSNAGFSWAIYHRSLTATQRIFFDTAAAGSSSAYWNDTEPTSTVFTVGTNGNVNQSGNTFVAYIFAHNAGGFGLTGTDNVISCGSFTTDGSGNATVSLGYEPQWVLVKRTSNVGDWLLQDNMRGMSQTNLLMLNPNTSNAEYDYGGPRVVPTATGFDIVNNYVGASQTAIYIAIRRGPMKVPTVGTSVYSPNLSASTVGTPITTGFPIDLQINGYRFGITPNFGFSDRLRGVSTTSTETQRYVASTSTAAESTDSNPTRNFGNTGYQQDAWLVGTGNGIYWNFRRAPSVFDEVCYTGTGSATTQAHNLGAVPEMMIMKRRSGLAGWPVYVSSLGPSSGPRLNGTNATFWGGSSNLNSTAPTSSVFTVGTDTDTNASGSTYVAYLFATCAGVSKVGTYTGNGTTQTINCGFTGGARFVLIKRTDATGDWYVYDTARGMTVMTDPYLRMNSTGAEVATLGSVTTVSTGFALNSAILAAINVSGGTYIFLAIA